MQQVNPIMELSILKEFYFDASHQLLEYDGNCQRLHGHTYKLVVEVARVAENGTTDLIKSGPKVGMVFDYADLKKVVHESVISKLDHYHLNDIFSLTTAEFMVKEITHWLIEAFQDYAVKVVMVALSEKCVPTHSMATIRIQS